jgi:hypothetical protein
VLVGEEMRSEESAGTALIGSRIFSTVGSKPVWSDQAVNDAVAI